VTAAYDRRGPPLSRRRLSQLSARAVPIEELPAGESAPDRSDRSQDDDHHEHPAESGPPSAGAYGDHGGDEQHHSDGDGTFPRALFLASHDYESIVAELRKSEGRPR